ncbi:hypothetical protein MAF45_02925 [Mesosutterella sp. OilRF-GAM-744-9]|uniref:Uncharacterized protein n=1 Tax=Mesosutterella porci TaxID=2915351 RepID=A0ABS9MP60_9BURK|nr:hypothetical protein [Mesosutterella sp. oilRF-744-WT-GAM-9]MCG5030400.1 hypothetical protein [Mesosutterella sp. oilRF-744-WT-GAM-9]
MMNIRNLMLGAALAAASLSAHAEGQPIEPPAAAQSAAAGQGAQPPLSAPTASPEAPAAASAEASVPAVSHKPEPVAEEPLPAWPFYAAGGAAVLVLALVLALRRRRHSELAGVRNAQTDFWNPIRFVPFHKDSKPLPQAGSGPEPGLEAVDKTVEAVMKAEAEERLRRGGSEGESARESGSDGSGQAPVQTGRIDPRRALVELLEAKVKLSRDFIARGAIKEARELAEDVRREPSAPEPLKAEAREILRELGPAPRPSAPVEKED